jgi:hypothetical protein
MADDVINNQKQILENQAVIQDNQKIDLAESRRHQRKPEQAR